MNLYWPQENNYPITPLYGTTQVATTTVIEDVIKLIKIQNFKIIFIKENNCIIKISLYNWNFDNSEITLYIINLELCYIIKIV